MVFSGRIVIVTGAGSGIGRALAVGFCADGAQVMGIGRRESGLEETSQLCAGGRMQFVVGDVGQPDNVERLFFEALRLYGKVDVLVNNAALYPKVAFLDCSHEDWSRVINTNLVGMAHCCRLALPGMLDRGFGRIVNIGSLAWMGPIPSSSAYCASKGAVRPFTRALASEIDRDRYPDVLVNELLPGIVKTAMSDSGENPADIYPHARFVANLPRKGPTGMTYLQSTLYVENRGLRARVKGIAGRIARSLSGRR